MTTESMTNPLRAPVGRIGTWTPRLVQAWLAKAADGQQHRPVGSASGALTVWPGIVGDDAVMDDHVMFFEHDGHRPPFDPPVRDAITRTDEVLGWLRWLEPDDARLIWARANGVPWKGIACRFGLSVRTAQRRHAHGLGVVVWRLHRRPIPSTWSRRFLLARVEALSRGK